MQSAHAFAESQTSPFADNATFSSRQHAFLDGSPRTGGLEGGRTDSRADDFSWGVGSKVYPTSSYPSDGPPSRFAAFGTEQRNVIGRDPPREVVRVERNYTSGDVAQFYTSFPLELEGRVTASQFQDLMNDINAQLVSANSFGHAVLDNILMVATFHLALLIRKSHFESEIDKLEALLEQKNREVWNPAGLNVLSPRKKAFLFLEIEYY